MNLLEHVHLAVQAVRANWLRGLLTALGVIIGIASLVALTAISAGAQEGVAADLRRLGPNIILLDGLIERDEALDAATATTAPAP